MLKHRLAIIYWLLKSLLLQIRYKRLKIGKNSIVEGHLKFCLGSASFITIGDKVRLSENSHLVAVYGGQITIKDNVYFNRNATIVSHKKIIIGENCLFGPNICIYDHDHIFTRNSVENKFTKNEIIIENDCWFGAGCIILKGAYVGHNSVVSAGIVVKGTIPPYSIVKSSAGYIIKEISDR